jgi:CubicO group peptidase (beta-lactamase class C family)
VGVLGGGETEVHAYGVGDLETGAPVRPGTAFRVASITKPFTATLAVLLEDEGRLSLDEPVPFALPNEGVTLAHLLSHTGGFAGEAGDLARYGAGDDALERAVAELGRLRRFVAPGEAWSYCNAGYWAAGLLCARAAGTTYENALRTYVLEPLALRSTGFGEPDARGHVQPTLGDPHHAPGPDVPYPRARRPGGGLVSTASDLLRFAAFQLEDERMARLRRPLTETPGGLYGLGLFGESVGGLDVWSHLGTYGGFQTLLAFAPERDAAFVILTNGTGGDAVRREVGDALLVELLGVRRGSPPRAELESGALAALAGRYESDELSADVAPGGSGLVVDLAERDPSGAEVRLPTLDARPVGERTFAIVGGQWADERFDFHPAHGPPHFLRIGSMLVPRC